MKLVLALLMAAVAIVFAEDKYTSQFDNINFKEVIENDRVWKSYFDCLTDAGPCPPPAKELKEHLAEAIKTDCEKCTDIQKTKMKGVFKEARDKKPEDFAKLEAKYDPGKVWRKNLDS